MNKNKARILIVDDNVSIHEDFKHILGSMSDLWKKGNEIKVLEQDLFGETEQENTDTLYEIDSAFQGEEAIDMFNKAQQEGNPYALIFMDVRMPPGMDGIRTSLAIWKKNPCTEIVICTAYSDYSWDKIVSAFGQTDHLLFIKKPFDTVSIRQMVVALVNKWKSNNQQKCYMTQLKEDLNERCRQIQSLQEHILSLKKNVNTEIISKSSFLSNIHYAISTPLSGIMGMADLLLDTELNEDQRKYTRTLIDSADSLLAITGSIFLITDYKAENFKPDSFKFDIRTMLETTTEFLKIIFSDKKIQISTIVNPDVPDKIFGDPGGIRQIILQLCEFLIKEKQTGVIILYVHVINNVSNNTGNIETVINIIGTTDNKLKVNNNVMSFNEKEVERFNQNKNQSKKLQISDILAEKMNLAIGFDEINERFCFKLEGNLEKKTSNVSFDFYGETISGVKVLILGKNPVSRKVLSLYIEHWNGKIFESVDVSSSIELVQSAVDTITPFDMVIVDLDNTNIEDYVSVISKFRRYSNLKTIPLICLTSRAERGDSQIIQDAGYWAFLTKPLKKTHLFLCISIIYKIKKGEAHYAQTGFLTKYILDELSNYLRYRVLVVENEQPDYLTSILEKHGIRCDTVMYSDINSINNFKIENEIYDAIIADGKNDLEKAIGFTRKFNKKLLKIVTSDHNKVNYTDIDNTLIISENEQELISAIKKSRKNIIQNIQ